MEYVLIPLFILFMAYFTFGPGSRLLKKKSHHYIIPPDPEKDADWRPVAMAEYKTYILIEKPKDFYIEKILLSRGVTMKKEDCFKPSEFGEWWVLFFDKLTFEQYHWLLRDIHFLMNPDGAEKKVVGFCKHQNKLMSDYVVKYDVGSKTEFLLGTFRDDKNFGVYLPKSGVNPLGNLSLSPVSEISFYTELEGIPAECLSVVMQKF